MRNARVYTHHCSLRAHACVLVVRMCTSLAAHVSDIIHLYMFTHIYTTCVLCMHQGVCRCLTHAYQLTHVRVLTVRRCTSCVRVRFPLLTAMDDKHRLPCHARISSWRRAARVQTAKICQYYGESVKWLRKGANITLRMCGSAVLTPRRCIRASVCAGTSCCCARACALSACVPRCSPRSPPNII